LKKPTHRSHPILTPQLDSVHVKKKIYIQVKRDLYALSNIVSILSASIFRYVRHSQIVCTSRKRKKKAYVLVKRDLYAPSSSISM